MCNLTSVEYLEIVGRHSLIFLAEGMQLRRLSIFECTQLSKRYGNCRGDGWLEIAHIPNIIIDLKLIQEEGCYLLSEEGCSSP